MHHMLRHHWTHAKSCRASQLQCELEEQATNVHKLQTELDKAEHRLSEKEVEVSVGKASVEAASRDISALKGELKAHAEASAKVILQCMPGYESVTQAYLLCLLVRLGD